MTAIIKMEVLSNIVRVPTLYAGLSAAGLTLEIALRSTIEASKVIGIHNQLSDLTKGITSKIPSTVSYVLRPFTGLKNKELAISAVACTVIGTLGWSLANYLSPTAQLSQIFIGISLTI